ncbi:MAG: helix-turn-helix transcriptional regulator [Sphingobium limneticum]
MNLGSRIEERLAAVGISQAELARRVGVRQSTVNSLIRGDSRTSRSLIKIARELRTTAAYLTGETDDPDNENAPEVSLGSDERELLGNFGNLTPADRRALLQIARSMAGGAPPSETVHPGGGVAPAAAGTVHDRKQDFKGEGGGL